MRVNALTDVGILRRVNQDYYFHSLSEVGSLPNLFIVADGMGGHKAGDLASRFTVEKMVELLKREDAPKDPIIAVNNAIVKVNSLLLEKASQSPDYDGMGTTLVVAVLYDDVMKVANVGDSRLYVLRDDGIFQITRDHSYVEEMVAMGKISKEQARFHKNKNVITRAIGGCEYVEPEIFSVDLKKRDRILLCTDGLNNMVDDKELLRIIKSNRQLEEIVQKLIDTANENGGRDNITAMLIEV